MSQAAATPELYQFRYAMFPEKTRWALEHCGIDYRSHAVLPGTHPPTMLRLAGQTCTPVLQLENTLLKSSSDIVEWAAEQNPDSGLYGDSPEQAAQVKEYVALFDQIGAHSRRAYFYQLLQCNGYAADIFSVGYSAKQQAQYRAAFPLIKAVMRLNMKITKKGAARSLAITKEALETIVERTVDSGYLVGGHFTAADLTAATVLGVCVLPDEYPVLVPKPYPAPLKSWIDNWANHPAADWVKHIYQQHRPQIYRY